MLTVTTRLGLSSLSLLQVTTAVEAIHKGVVWVFFIKQCSPDTQFSLSAIQHSQIAVCPLLAMTVVRAQNPFSGRDKTLLGLSVTWAAQTWEGHKTQAQPSLRLWGLPECLNLSGLDLGAQPRAGLWLFPAEQPRAQAVWAGRLHAPWAGADPVWLRHCERMPVLSVCSIPPSLPTARLNKWA